MANYNKVILAGNLTRDPQLSYTPNNTPVCEFGMAINRRWRSQDGQNRENTCYVDCRLYGRGAEVFNQYMSKGRPTLIDGRLDYQQWETPEGQKRSKLMVIAENFQFLGSGPSRGGSGSAPRSEGEPSAPSGPRYNDDAPPPGDPDIPF